MDKENLEFISLKGNGIGDDRKRMSLFNWLKSHHDATNKFTFLQEMHTTSKIEKLWEDDWGHKILLLMAIVEARESLFYCPVILTTQ